MTFKEQYTLNKALHFISNQAGILSYISKLPTFSFDPRLMAYGIWPCDTSRLAGKKWSGRASGCGYTWIESALTTIGEVVERYCPTFYNSDEFIRSSYKNLCRPAIHPSKIALFHKNQYNSFAFPFIPFTEDVEVQWTSCYDMINGREVLYPASMIYLPYLEKGELIGLSTSTGLAGHIDLHEAMLVGLYEAIERDSFTITWMQELNVPKIKITDDIRLFLNDNYPANYEYHFFDITFDLKVPSILGMCFGESEYGKFIAIGSATRGTYSEALHKVIKEMGHAVSYFRYLLGEKRDWYPTCFDDLHSFEDHSIFYLKRTDLWHVFDKWRDICPTKEIDFAEKRTNTTIEEILRMVNIFSQKQYDVLFKNLTTEDVRDNGFYSIKMVVPQLIQLGGAYNLYFSGGERLYEVPKLMGYETRDYEHLNKYPHPFP